jgi:transcription-repair coupling factor (superfamily II helicase)
MGSQLPYRLDLFDDEIESIKTFDVDTQRTLYPVPEVRLLPAREFPGRQGAHPFPPAFPRGFEGDPAKSGIYKDISAGIASGRHRVLAAAVLRGNRHPLRLPAERRRSLPAQRCAGSHRAFWRDTQSRYDMLPATSARPLLPPDELFLSEEAVLHRRQALRSTDLFGTISEAQRQQPRPPSVPSTAAPRTRSAR